MPNIRMLKNVILAVDVDGESNDIAFSFGDMYEAVLIRQDDNGYADVVLNNKVTIRGIATTLFENNNTPVEKVKSLAPAKKAVLIKANVETEKATPLEGVSVSEQPVKDKTGRYRK